MLKQISAGWQIPETHTSSQAGWHTSFTPTHCLTMFPSPPSRLGQTRPAAERDCHTAAPQPGQADAPPRGLHPHLHRLCKLQPQAHRRSHLPAACWAPEAHWVSGVSNKHCKHPNMMNKFNNVVKLGDSSASLGGRAVLTVLQFFGFSTIREKLFWSSTGTLPAEWARNKRLWSLFWRHGVCHQTVV